MAGCGTLRVNVSQMAEGLSVALHFFHLGSLRYRLKALGFGLLLHAYTHNFSTIAINSFSALK